MPVLWDWDRSKQGGDIGWGIRIGLGRNGEKGTALWGWDMPLGRRLSWFESSGKQMLRQKYKKFIEGCEGLNCIPPLTVTVSEDRDFKEVIKVN